MFLKTFLLTSSLSLLSLAGCGNAPGDADSVPEGAVGAVRQALSGTLVLDVPTTSCNTNVAINNAIGQSFKVPSQLNVHHLDIWIKPDLYYTTSYNLEIYDGEGTAGSKLATSTILSMNSQSSGQAAGWYSFGFAVSPTLFPAHAYTFRLVRLSTYSGAFSSCGNVYADGIEYWLGASASSREDISFRLYKATPGAVLGDAPCNSHVQLRSWKGDLLLRPDTAQGVTTGTTASPWTVECPTGGGVDLRSWKGDLLHRPDSPQGVTTWFTGNPWIVENQGLDRVMLRSWKDDYLHRPDTPEGVTTWVTGIGNLWTVELAP